MTVPPLFDHLDTEDEDQLEHDTTLQESGLEADTEHQATRAHPRGMRERAQAWLHVEPFYWTMRVVYVCLAAGAVFASTSTASPKAGGGPGAKNPASQPQPPPLSPRPHHHCRARPQCRAATRSAPTASSCAQPNTPHQHIRNPNYPPKPQKTPKEAQKQRQNTTSHS